MIIEWIILFILLVDLLFVNIFQRNQNEDECNFVRYRKELKKLAEENAYIAIVNGKPVNCDDCKDCRCCSLHCSDGTHDTEIIRWALERKKKHDLY